MDNAEKLLELKKASFVQEVENAAKQLGAPTSQVYFIDEGAPCILGNEMAHIHVEDNIICFRKIYLANMSNDDLRQIAMHEVSHLVSPRHDSLFQKVKSEVSTESWRPPPGVVWIRSEGQVVEPEGKAKPKKSKRLKKEGCGYHSCKLKSKLKKCPFCGELFCKTHLKPIPPGMPRFSSTDIQDALRRNEGAGHPCVPYFEYLEAKEEAESKAYTAALDRLAGRGEVEAAEPQEIDVKVDKSKSGCAICGKKDWMGKKCKFCGEWHCSKHILPEKHNCPGTKSLEG